MTKRSQSMRRRHRRLRALRAHIAGRILERLIDEYECHTYECQGYSDSSDYKGYDRYEVRVVLGGLIRNLRKIVKKSRQTPEQEADAEAALS